MERKTDRQTDWYRYKKLYKRTVYGILYHNFNFQVQINIPGTYCMLVCLGRIGNCWPRLRNGWQWFFKGCQTKFPLIVTSIKYLFNILNAIQIVNASTLQNFKHFTGNRPSDKSSVECCTRLCCQKNVQLYKAML